MRICVIGDSVTWGAYLPFRGAWANLLHNYLETSLPHSELYDLGIDRNTSKDVVKRFDAEMEARRPDIIICAIGINDSLFRENINNMETSPADFKKNIKTICQKGLQFTKNVYFVGITKGSDEYTNPLQRSTTGKCYTKAKCSEYNSLLKEVVSQEKLEFIDLSGVLSDEDFDDGLHPNLGGHNKIFETVRRAITASDEIKTLLTK